MFEIFPIEASEVTKLACPHCKEKVHGVGLSKESKIEGLSFRCRRCGFLWGVKTK